MSSAAISDCDCRAALVKSESTDLLDENGSASVIVERQNDSEFIGPRLGIE